LTPQAIIEDLNTKKEEAYRLGDIIHSASLPEGEDSGIKIVEIQRDRVVFERDGEISVLFAYAESVYPRLAVPGTRRSSNNSVTQTINRIEKIGENRWRVYRSDLLGAAGDRQHLLAQVKISPYLEKGRMMGFKIGDIDEVSIINQTGVEDGDVIEKVNGERINSIAKAREVYGEVKGKPLITLDVKRGEETVKLSYEILD